ncbi:MAG: ISKra4 family transposase [Pseudomonadota bacterium]
MNNITKISEALAEQIQQELSTEYTLSDVEKVTRLLVQEIGRQAIALVVDAEEKPHPEPEISCPSCGQVIPYVRRRSARLRTLFGSMGVKRAYYLCSACHRGYFPLDERLGLRPNAISAELERLAAMTGALLPFGKGRDLFEALTLLSLSDQTLDKATQAYGAVAMWREEGWQATAFDQEELLRRKREEQKPLRLYGAVDACKVHTRGGEEECPWRDLKVGAWFEARGKPPKTPDDQWRIQAENIHYYVDICPASEFGSLMWSTGVQHHAQLAVELIMLGDGAEWIWNLVEKDFPKAVQILDWFHATEYLMPVARAVYSTEESQIAWLKQAKQALWDGKVDEVIKDCLNLARTEDSSDPAFVAARYFDQNRERMDYPTYRRQGYQIGSGTIESAAKQIGTMRMKVAGAIWNEDSARKVAKARAAYLSDEWDELAAYRELPLAV